MPFKSTAQQRYMYARHPEIAERWTNEMRNSRRKGAKQHPIKSAGLPNHVGKRVNGGSFDSGPSAIVRGVSRGTVRRGRTTSRFGGTPSHGSRKAEPGLEVYRPSRVAKAGAGPLFTPTNALPRPKTPQVPPPTTGAPPAGAGASAGDGRPGTLVPTGGSASAPTATPASSASTPSSAPTTGTIGAAANMTAQPKRAVGQRGPAKLSKALDLSGLKQTGRDIGIGLNIARDTRPGMLIPTGKPTIGNRIGQAIGASTATPGRTAATLGGTAVVGGGTAGAFRSNRQDDLSKADGTMLVRMHGNYARDYDPESNRQRRLGQAQATTALGGAAGVGAGAKHLRDLNRHSKVVPRQGAATALHRTVAVNRRGAAAVGAGLAGLAASNRLRRYAKDPSNRRWD